jgi:type IV pilus assembly protein PilB
MFGRRGRLDSTETEVRRAELRPALREQAIEGVGRIGELLATAGTPSAAIDEALAVQERDPRPLGEILIAAGATNSKAILAALSSQSGIPVIDVRGIGADTEALSVIPADIARRHSILPIGRSDETLRVAITDPFDPDLAEVLTRLPVALIDLTVADRDDVRALINLHYRDLDTVGGLVDAFEETKPEFVALTTKIEVEENAPVAQVLNRIVAQALRDRASDIHIEPMDEQLRVRFRVDGRLHEVLSLPASIGAPLVSRLKILAEMNIVERRRPQDGQFTTVVDNRELDVRVSTVATIFGEKAVLRLLDKGRSMRSITDLGMPQEAFVRYNGAITAPYGMVLVTGPTGSGKTTTLYASLRMLDRGDVNIMTIEDPVEYVFPGVNQIEINNQAEVTFATGLKSILRQDPDLILVGEVRDQETARIAIQSALTGHMVLSSLHAVDSVSSLFRLLDMGIEPFLVTSAVTGVVAQRLVRRICSNCAEPYEPSAAELSFYREYGGRSGATFKAGAGCSFCSGSGYRERVGVYEVMTVSEELRQAVVAGASPRDIRDLAEKEGMRSLRTEALDLVAAGTTTIAEVLRTVHMTS